MTEIHTGSCLCGAVRFRTRGKLRDVIACHCSQCRKQTGLYYAATNVPISDIELEGEENITWFRASDFARRGFCRTCGSALFWQADKEDYLSVLAGSFDQPTGLRVGKHIFCADKADFYGLPDDAPHYAQGSPGLVVAGNS